MNKIPPDHLAREAIICRRPEPVSNVIHSMFSGQA